MTEQLCVGLPTKPQSNEKRPDNEDADHDVSNYAPINKNISKARIHVSDIKHFELHDVTNQNIGQFRQLCLSCLPIQYQNSFYEEICKTPTNSKLAFLGELLVGAIASRILDKETQSPQLYITVLAVLKPYRRLGIASYLLVQLLKDMSATQIGIKEVMLHVWCKNTEALKFYERHGFKILQEIDGYYDNIEPSMGYELKRLMTID